MVLHLKKDLIHKGQNSIVLKDSYDKLSKKSKIIWLSGLFDGEGSFGLWSKGVGKKKAFSATIEMGDEDIIKRFHDMFGGAVWKTKKKQERFRQLWRWRCVGDRAYDCIDKMIEYMGTRRQEKYHVVKSDISSR